jgi:hypothetical protein
MVACYRCMELGWRNLSLSQAIIRAQQRSSKRTIKIEIVEQRGKGLPPHQMEVTKNGKIDGACDGKNIVG